VATVKTNNHAPGFEDISSELAFSVRFGGVS